MRNLTILGGGNTAFAAAANLSLRGFQVTICEHPDFAYTLDPVRNGSGIVLDGVAARGRARIHALTTDFQEGLKNDLLLLIVPAYAHRPFALACAPYLREGHTLVLLPGTLGTLEFHTLLREKGRDPSRITLAETDTAPYVCRKLTPDSAHIWGVVSALGLGVLPASETGRTRDLLRSIFTVDGLGEPDGEDNSAVSCYGNVFECGLSAMNPVVHPPGVLMNAGRVEYSRGDFYFYEEGVTPGVCNAIYGVDRERRQVGRALGFELSVVDEAFSLAGFGPRGDLWSTINGSRMLTQLRAPGELNTRWLTEDVPYGLGAWSSLGRHLGVATPLMDGLVALASAALGEDFRASSRTVRRLGIAGMGRDQLLRFAETGEVPG